MPQDANQDARQDANQDRRPAVSIPFALRYQLERGFRPYTRGEVQRLPRNRCGVYAIWTPSEYDASPTPLYIGKSETCVRRRLLDHLSENEPNSVLRLEMRYHIPAHIQFTAAYTTSPAETDALETAMIAEFLPPANRNKMPK